MKNIKILLSIIFMFLISEAYSQAEKIIDKEQLFPIFRMENYPISGKVMYNSPSFICTPKILSNKGLDTYVFDYSYRYMFRVSQDDKFLSTETICSDTLEWTFFNVHQKLKKGKWYWQYAYVSKLGVQWHKAIEFTISGSEYDFVSPSINTIISNISNEHPRILSEKQNIGKINMPKRKKQKLYRNVDRNLNAKLPSLIYNNIEVMKQKKKKMSAKNYNLFITKRTRDNCKKYAKKSSEVVMLYLISGQEKYLKEALRRYRHFSDVYAQILKINQYNDFTEVAYFSVLSDVLDIAYDYLSEDEKHNIIDLISKHQSLVYSKILHKPSHVLHDSHFWQIELRSFFLNSLLLMHHNPDAEKWLAYAYELYVVRAPTGSLTDGGWAPGNKYFAANAETLFVLPYVLTRISGFDFFSKPWYKSVSEYLAYTSPIAHVSSNFGDGSDTKENMYPFVKSLNRIKKNKYAEYYIAQYKQYGSKKKKSTISKLDWYSYQPLALELYNIKADFSKAKQFADVGTVVMNTNIYTPSKNVMLAFRASPFGVVGHAHAAQNAFNIQYAGTPLFFHTGYYTSWADSHSLLSYKHTRAHNSILVDGVGQTFHSSGYAWIARFFTSQNISYALGDASKAYSGTIYRDVILKQMKKYNITPTKEFGFSDPGLEMFRRHIFMLEPGIIVIYDVLEAKTPVNWTLLANSRERIIGKNKAWICKSNAGKAIMQVFSQDDFTDSISDKFYSKAIDWQSKGKKLNNLKTCWHAKAKTSKMKKTRFLSIIQVDDIKSNIKLVKINKHSKEIKIKDWTIKVNLDASTKASFVIQKKNSVSVSYNYKSVVLNKKSYTPIHRNATLLLINNKGKLIAKEYDDVLPDAYKYY